MCERDGETEMKCVCLVARQCGGERHSVPGSVSLVRSARESGEPPCRAGTLPPLSLSLSQGVNTHLLSTTRARSLRHTGLPMYMYLVTKRVLVFEL